MRTKDLQSTGTADQRSSIVQFSSARPKSPRKRSSEQDKPAPKRRNIFIAEPRNSKEIASEVIWADCMNHGYRLEKSIGEGAYAKVKLAEVLPGKLARNQTLAEVAEEDGVLQVAIKIIENKQVPKEFLRKFLPRELSNHVPLPPHRNVVRVFEQFRTSERVYVVMEYCSKGDLLDLINQQISKSHRGLGEEKARAMFKQLCEGVLHIHNNGIVHRDLKCENILIDENNQVKITDFGFSTKFSDKGAMLRTSCGSYAYTAPEVIKSTPYDGFKSDTWSLGVILFAMLNGRLPFNDSQLMEMEEDMKLQRFRFERSVSFDSMVLVRRILQYNASQRPAVQEILNDPWLTGKKMIPRQINRPKWINPYGAKKEEPILTDVTLVGSNPAQQTAAPEKGQDAKVTVKQDGNETVVLKSRVSTRKNIWASGPAGASHNRPNTWPKPEKEQEELTVKRRQNRTSREPRSCVRNKSANTTLTAKTLPEGRDRNDDLASGPKARASSKTLQLSKLFMDKYTKKKNEEENNDQTEGDSRDYCLAEEGLEKSPTIRKNVPSTEEQVNQEKTSQFHSRDISEGGCISSENGRKSVNENEYDTELKTNLKTDIKVETKPVRTRKQDSGVSTPSTSRKSAEMYRQAYSPEVKRQTLTKSARTRDGNYRKGAGATDLISSKSLDLSKPVLLTYVDERSTSAAERVKYFRARLMKFYGRGTGKDELPPLMVQALRPPPDSSVKTSTVKSASSVNRVWQSAGPRGRSLSLRTKPVQRTVVHSAP